MWFVYSLLHPHAPSLPQKFLYSLQDWWWSFAKCSFSLVTLNSVWSENIFTQVLTLATHCRVAWGLGAALWWSRGFVVLCSRLCTRDPADTRGLEGSQVLTTSYQSLVGVREALLLWQVGCWHIKDEPVCASLGLTRGVKVQGKHFPSNWIRWVKSNQINLDNNRGPSGCTATHTEESCQ